jgi:hypothetical protein
MMPLLLLNGDAELDDDVYEDKFLAEALEIVPTFVADIHEFWPKYRKPPYDRG